MLFWFSALRFLVQLEIKSWLITGENLSMELLKTDKGNATAALSHLEELQNISASSHKTVRPLHDASVCCTPSIPSATHWQQLMSNTKQTAGRKVLSVDSLPLITIWKCAWRIPGKGVFNHAALLPTCLEEVSDINALIRNKSRFFVGMRTYFFLLTVMVARANLYVREWTDNSSTPTGRTVRVKAPDSNGHPDLLSVLSRGLSSLQITLNRLLWLRTNRQNDFLRVSAIHHCKYIPSLDSVSKSRFLNPSSMNWDRRNRLCVPEQPRLLALTSTELLPPALFIDVPPRRGPFCQIPDCFLFKIDNSNLFESICLKNRAHNLQPTTAGFDLGSRGFPPAVCQPLLSWSRP